MKRKLTLYIEAGEQTCYSAPNEPCPHVYTTHFGQHCACALFGPLLAETEEGWLKRHADCLKSEETE